MRTRELLATMNRRQFLGMAAGLTARTPRRTGAVQPDVGALVAGMAPHERAARLFMVPVADTELTADEERWLRMLKPGGVILTQHNFGPPEEVRALVAAIHATHPELPPLVAVDQEGGLVSRIVDDPAPDAPTLGQLPPEEIARLARLRADMLAGYGFDVNFAPVADVALSPESAMAGRAFGSDPLMVAEDVAAYVSGVAGSRVRHCAKHFPGHGRVVVDSHETLPVLDVEPALWQEADAVPFQAAVDAGVPMVMLGHLVFPAWDELPASLSPEAVRVLREVLGFAGVVVSDDLGMGALGEWDPLEAVDLAVAAGIDLLLYVILTAPLESLIGHVAARIERDAVAAERIAASVERLLRLYD